MAFIINSNLGKTSVATSTCFILLLFNFRLEWDIDLKVLKEHSIKNNRQHENNVGKRFLNRFLLHLILPSNWKARKGILSNMWLMFSATMQSVIFFFFFNPAIL